MTLAGVRRHVRRFDAIARANGGNRAAGTEGYDESARYVYERLEQAGYEVRLQEFPLGAYVEEVERARVVERGPRELDVEAIDHSPSTRRSGITGRVAVVPVDEDGSHGCEAEDFRARSYARTVALIKRGECTFGLKAKNAAAAGALAAIVYSDTQAAASNWAMTPEEATIPALGVSRSAGEALADEAADGDVVLSLTVRAATESSSANVIAETGAAGDPVVMAGGHLDSVEAGPGANDNGSGSAALLEIAVQLAKLEPRAKVRFAFWGAEELGLVGSRYYATRLGKADSMKILVYLNFDMLGSRNFGRFAIAGTGALSARAERASRAVERLFVRYFRARGRPVERLELGSRSDHASFRRRGVPTGGLFTGAGETKTAEKARAFGGEAGEPYDACYHEACDTYANVDFNALHEMADAAAHAVATFAANPSLLE